MLEMLRKIVQEVNTAETLSEALEIIVVRVRDAMGTEVCTVFMRDTATNRFVFEATEGLNKELLGEVDVVVMCQAAASRASNRKLFDSLAAHWQKSGTAGSELEQDEG